MIKIINQILLKPKMRSKLRIKLGSVYYTWKRYGEWIFSKRKYANKYQKELLPHIIFKHRTILLRKLRNVDMWYQHNKITNLKIAVAKLDGIIVNPGETFSYWRLIGKTTKKKGYVPGMVLYYGTFKSGIGGGLCQLSNLIYWMTTHTPLTVTERHRHSYDVFPDSNRTQPFGSGATCAYNYLDLQIKNETDQPYQLHLYLNETHLVGEWRALQQSVTTYEVYEREHTITTSFWGAYLRHNTIYRRVYNRNHQLIDDQFVTENHAIMMYEPLLPEPLEDCP